MYGSVQRDDESTPLSTRLGAEGEGDGQLRATQEPVVRAPALKTAIAQLKDIAKASDGRSSGQALVANLMLLRSLGVDEEALDLVVTIVLAQNVDEEMTATVNYLASGFVLALLTLREEGSVGTFCNA